MEQREEKNSGKQSEAAPVITFYLDSSQNVGALVA